MVVPRARIGDGYRRAWAGHRRVYHRSHQLYWGLQLEPQGELYQIL
jgi:hypothetical protein